jgi:hypothetical protein
MLPVELIQLIIDYMDYNSQISFKHLNKELYNQLYITNLDVHKTKLITQKILDMNPEVRILNLYSNNNILNLNKCKYLRILNISNTDFTFDDIKELKKLEELNITNNTNFFDITNFPELKTLKINGLVNINYNDILKLPKLVNLHIFVNPRKKEILNIVKNKYIIYD